ncbi:OPT superfamily oligopeptide transporter [Acephala macrosclerotiorum]|nr:OPT superfamily oligopeptide transporter [Acephala macrosclerotiorum]
MEKATGPKPDEIQSSSEDALPQFSEKKNHDIEIDAVEPDYDDLSTDKIYVPGEDEEFIDPRLKDYPIPLVAKTVDLHNDPTEPILTFRFWFLSTFWVVVGCGISSFYYFKPYYMYLTSYAIQLLSWGMGSFMANRLPKRTFSTFGRKWSFNPGPWNPKEHALIIVAYWGSCYTAYGLGPLSAMELYYGKKMNAGWGILFLITTQMIGYGFAGLFRDILVRPPKIYYPGVLPNVALFNAMHRNPSVTKKSLKFFSYVAVAAFVWEWFPQLIFPILSSLPLLCYMGHGNGIAYILGSGYNGFGLLDISLDWNYISFWSPLYTPLWANANQFLGAMALCWFIYPLMYFTNTLDAKTYAPMSSGTFDDTGATYNISRILNADHTLNQTAMDAYSRPQWSVSYAMYFFCGFAASTGAMLYACLYYGPQAWQGIKEGWFNKRDTHNDPYLLMMDKFKRVPHWWYAALLVICAALSIGQLYGAGMQLPWWGFLIISIVSCVFTFPNGILWGIANMQVGMAFLSEVIAGALFPGKPLAVLTCMVYGRQILEQNLNLISDYKFGFYMKIPESEMFIGQVYGTLLGPFINYGMMRWIIDNEGPKLTGEVASSAWDALKTKNFYSQSVLWGVLGPKVFFGAGSQYSWLYYAFLVGPACVLLVWLVQKKKPGWNLEERFNPVLIFSGGTWFPVYQTANLLTSSAFSAFFMGYVYRYHPVWFRKYNYLLGVGLDCGTQLMQTVMVFGINLPNVAFPYWWGNNPNAIDRCFPPSTLPAGAQ